MANYQDLDRAQLIRELQRRDQERSLGLVWERDAIEYDRTLNEEFVALEADPENSAGSPPYTHLLIEGDNFDALRYLRMAFRGRVKCIYIDPPYNTGNRDFIYNDKYVSNDHAYRHSLWLEHLYQRLNLARELLTEDGVILVSINDENRCRLDMLMEQVFPGMRVGSMVWRRRGANNSNPDYFFSEDHEHVLVYAGPEFSFKGSGKDWSGYDNWDENHKDYWTSGPLTLGFDKEQRPNLFYPLYNPSSGLWYPCNPNAVWRFATKKLIGNREVRTQPMEDMIEDGRVFFPSEEQPAYYYSIEEIKEDIESGKAPPYLDKQDNLEFWVGKPIAYKRPRQKRFHSELKSDLQPLSSWIKKANDSSDPDKEEDPYFLRSGYTREGTNALRKAGLSGSFYPKPPSLIRSLIDQATDTDDLVLDFYAGSGTTGTATMEVNQADGGSRRFILVSAPEATESEPDKNVCRDIAATRLKRFRESQDSELPSVGYFGSLRVPYTQLYEDLHHDQVWLALQMLHLETVASYDDQQPFQSAEAEGIGLFYLPKVSREVLERLVAAVDSQEGVPIIYSWSPGKVEEWVMDERAVISPIPETLVRRFGGEYAP